jgi:hypothetical protein
VRNKTIKIFSQRRALACACYQAAHSIDFRSMTKAELLIQSILAGRLGVDDSEIKLYHIQHFCRNADKRDI